MTSLLGLRYFYIIIFAFVCLSAISSNKIRADQKVNIISDKIIIDQENENIEASGNAIAIDKNGGKIQAENIQYNKLNSKLIAQENVIVNDLEGNTFFMDVLETADNFDSMNGRHVKARMKDGARIVGSQIKRSKH